MPMIRTFLDKRKVRRAVEKFVDSETANRLLRDGTKAQPLKHGRVEFILAFVRGESPVKVSERIARVADLATTHGAMVHDLVGALVIMAFGTQPALSSESGSRSSLVRALREQLGGDVKIGHGAAHGHYGLFGNKSRMSYSFLVPKFDAMLGTLSRLEFGEFEEFRQ